MCVLWWVALAVGGLLPVTAASASQQVAGHSTFLGTPPLLPTRRRIQQSTTTTITMDFANPRAPLHRTPDNVPEPNAIPAEELQALWLQQQSPLLNGDKGATNREEPAGEDSNEGNPRRRFLLFAILLPTVAFVLGAFVLLRPNQGLVWRQVAERRNNNTETEGLFQTPEEPSPPPTTNTPEQPYRDDAGAVPEKGYAEITRNVV